MIYVLSICLSRCMSVIHKVSGSIAFPGSVHFRRAFTYECVQLRSYVEFAGRKRRRVGLFRGFERGPVAEV